MTNEMLAQFIQQGGNDELIPILWEKVRKLLYAMSDRFYRLNKDTCDSSGVEAWDIKQASYVAFLEAVKAYKPDSGNKFTAYIKYPFKNALRELLGIRTSKQEPLNNCGSLDKPIEQSDGDSCSLYEIIEDSASLDFTEKAERNCEAETVRAIVDTLSEPYRGIIKAHFFEGMTLAAIGEKNGYSTSRTGQLYRKALRILRQDKQLRQIWTEQKQHYNWLQLARFQHSPEYYAVIQRAKEHQLSYGQRQADLFSAMQKWKQN